MSADPMTTSKLRFSGAVERRAALTRVLTDEGYVSLADMASRLGVSDRTIRRDLQDFAQTGIAVIVPGGARLASPPLSGPTTAPTHAAMVAEVIRRIGNSPTIAIGSSPFGPLVIDQMPPLAERTIVTASLPALWATRDRDDLRTVALGGVLDLPSQSFTGAMAREEISTWRIDVAIIGAAGIIDGSIYATNPTDAEITRTLLDVSARVLVIADADRIGRPAPVFICATERLDAIITGPEPLDVAAGNTGCDLIRVAP